MVLLDVKKFSWHTLKNIGKFSLAIFLSAFIPFVSSNRNEEANVVYELVCTCCFGNKILPFGHFGFVTEDMTSFVKDRSVRRLT